MGIFQPAMLVYKRVGGETSSICCFHPYLGKMGRFPTWLAHIFQMGGSNTNQICFVFVAPIPGMPEITRMTGPNSNPKPRVMWGFQVVYSYKFVREDGFFHLVKMKLNLRPAIDSTSMFLFKNPSCRLCEKKSHGFFKFHSRNMTTMSVVSTPRPGFNLGDPANGLCLGCPVGGQLLW